MQRNDNVLEASTAKIEYGAEHRTQGASVSALRPVLPEEGCQI